MLGIYGRAIAGATVVPAARKVGLFRPDGLPDRRLTRDEVKVDRHHLAEYDRVCGFRLRDELPPTYPHIVAFPLAMELMTEPTFPFPAIGLVHIENRIDVVRPMLAGEPFSVKVWAGDLGDHERGKQFVVHAEASVAGAGVVWRDASTYLSRGGGSGGEKSGEERSSSPEPPAASAVWDVPADTGRRYAAVSGDHNPIHLYSWTAKTFGMKTNIAHGMWTKARCLAALEGELPDAYSVEVRFKLPIFLPAKVAFSTDTREFSVRDAKSGKPHLEGRISAPQS
jgi:acyl dehydratase